MSLEDDQQSPDLAPSQAADRQQPRRIGLFGGTFDPPHIGHFIVAERVREALDLDEVRLVVANKPWQKISDRIITDASTRVEMVRSALVGHPKLVASAVELEIGGPSYTMATLEYLHEHEPDVEWLVIVGADAAAGLDTWHRAAELAAMVEIIVVDRPSGVGQCVEYAAEVPRGWRSKVVDVPLIEVSSTDLRARVSDGSSIHFLTPEPVVALIEKSQLYRRRR